MFKVNIKSAIFVFASSPSWLFKMASLQGLPSELKIIIIELLAMKRWRVCKHKSLVSKSICNKKDAAPIYLAWTEHLSGIGRYMERGFDLTDLGRLASVDKTFNTLISKHFETLIAAELKRPISNCFALEGGDLKTLHHFLRRLNPVARARVNSIRTRWRHPILNQTDQTTQISPHDEWFRLIARSCPRVLHCTIRIDLAQWLMETAFGETRSILQDCSKIEGFLSLLDLEKAVLARRRSTFCILEYIRGQGGVKNAELDLLIAAAREHHSI